MLGELFGLEAGVVVTAKDSLSAALSPLVISSAVFIMDGKLRGRETS
jgi:hypothetical protein